MTPAQFTLATSALIQVCDHFHYSLGDLESKARYEPLATCRHLALKLAKDRSNLPDEAIGLLIGRTPSAVLSSRYAAQAILDTEPKYRAVYSQWFDVGCSMLDVRCSPSLHP